MLSDLARFFSSSSAVFRADPVITLFSLLDYITLNNINFAIVANYLLFLLPWIVNSVAPMAVACICDGPPSGFFIRPARLWR